MVAVPGVLADRAVQTVDKDTMVARPDLGDNTATLVVAGGEIPTGLEGNKRTPRSPAATPKKTAADNPAAKVIKV